MTMTDQVGLVIIATGVLFDLLGCIGMVRLPDVYNRLQAGTKCVTLGVCLILTGTAVMADATPIRLKAVLCALFVLITSPTAAHALARAARVSGIRLWEKSVADQFARSK
ncbi:MAG: Na+/H+ antiporter subunit G [Planctomycetales bacterium]|nr:Na+/H+ antiporter subunit G [Planctomycetales bacterium]NIM08871.1 Na+/H+ antiporter subunit G [Planctomycetales bacterium]NIN08331.1 Na+/H+ antiporter subunit G [Planctomycetales bacterium]NIN77459.1 Na+/H+ antiporter subunit G [Planctomycetales bacterium]NIO34631.1 Na+/H+ antiporter subunit G [Planctomycetales bacterium]